MREADVIAVLSGVKEKKDAARTAGGNVDERITSASLPEDIEDGVAKDGVQTISNLNQALVALDTSELPPATREALQNEIEEVRDTPRSFFERTLEELERVQANAEDFINLGSEEYDEIFNRTATLRSTPTKVATNAEFDLLNSLRQARQSIQTILSTDVLFKSEFDARIQDIINRFDNRISLDARQAVKQITLPANTSLPRLAQQELGDSTRWGEIVEVNNLSFPYVTDDLSSTKSGVLRPGDKILIPTPVQEGFSQVPLGAENKLTEDMSQLEKSLGVDLKLSPNFDLVLSNSGDFELVAGADNMAQAVVLKLSYEKGDVIHAPTIGASTVPGRKFPPLTEIKDDIIRTLLQDVRIQRVEDLALLQNNSELQIKFNLKIKQVDIPIPITIKV
jgi:hypothetical protein